MAKYKQISNIRVNSATTQSDLTANIADQTVTLPKGATGVHLSYLGDSIVYVYFNSSAGTVGIPLSSSGGDINMVTVELDPGTVMHVNASVNAQTISALWMYH